MIIQKAEETTCSGRNRTLYTRVNGHGSERRLVAHAFGTTGSEIRILLTPTSIISAMAPLLYI